MTGDERIDEWLDENGCKLIRQEKLETYLGDEWLLWIIVGAKLVVVQVWPGKKGIDLYLPTPIGTDETIAALAKLIHSE